MASAVSNYARALADVIVSKRLDPATAMQQLNAMVEATEGSPELRNVWQNPAVEHKQKLALLDAIAQRAGLDKTIRNFVAVLIDNHRVAALPEIARQVKAELNERTGVAEAEVITARELGEDERRQLESEIARTTGRRIVARYTLDPKLIGGAVVKVGSTIYDGSVRGQLHRLKQQIATG